jgi:excinuclease UvrABC nuclease subunit
MYGATPIVEARRQRATRALLVPVFASIFVVACVCVFTLSASSPAPTVVMAEEGDKTESVANALLKHAGMVPKAVALPDAIVKGAQQAAKEVTEGVHIPSSTGNKAVSSSIEKEVQQAQEEISIEKKLEGAKKDAKKAALAKAALALKQQAANQAAQKAVANALAKANAPEDAKLRQEHLAAVHHNQGKSSKH